MPVAVVVEGEAVAGSLGKLGLRLVAGRQEAGVPDGRHTAAAAQQALPQQPHGPAHLPETPLPPGQRHSLHGNARQRQATPTMQWLQLLQRSAVQPTAAARGAGDSNLHEAGFTS